MSLHRICAGGVTKPYHEPGSFMAALIRHMTYAIKEPGEASATVVSFIVCGRCYRTGAGYFSPEYVELDGYLEAVCPNCKEPIMVHIDQGKLDLGLVRDSHLRPDDFRIFGETFEQVARCPVSNLPS